MRRRRRRDPLKVGIFVVLLLAAVSYMTFHKRLPFVHGYRVHAIFASANQLKKGSPVRIAGVDVGKVSGLGQGPGNTADVTMELSKSGLPVHTDATAKIRPRLFLEGGFYVQLDPGSPSAPTVHSGSTLPVTQTTTPVQFHQVLTALDQDTRAQLKSTLSVTAKALDRPTVRAFQQVTRSIAPALKDVAVVTHAAQGTEVHDVSRFVSAASALTGTLSQHDAALGDLVTSLNRTAGALASTDGALADTVRQTDALLRDAPSQLSAFDRALPTIASFAAAATPALRIAPPVLDKTSALLAQLQGLSSPNELPALLAKLKTALGKFPSLETNLNTLFPLTQAATDCVTQRTIPTLDQVVPDGKLSSGRPAWQDLLHGLVGLASSSQDFDANGPWVRYLGSFGNQTVSLGSASSALGTLVGTGGAIAGARPVWLGPLTDAAYRPDAPCTQQPMPNLTLRATANDATQAVASYRTVGKSQTSTSNSARSLLSSPDKLRALLGGGK